LGVCIACGRENPQGAKFCNECGAGLVAAPASRQQRKTVTVLFCDVTGSTALGERLDPESFRQVMRHYLTNGATARAARARRLAAEWAIKTS